MSNFTTDDVLDSLYKLRGRESDQLKTRLELYDLEIDQKISEPDYHRLKTMEKRSIDQKLRSRNTLTPEMGRLKQGQWLRIAGINVVLRKDQENAINGMQKDSVVQNRHQCPSGL